MYSNPAHSPSAYSYPYGSSPSPSPSPRPSPPQHQPHNYQEEQETLSSSPGNLHRRTNSLTRQGSFPPSYAKSERHDRVESDNTSLRSYEYNYAAWNRASTTSTAMSGGNLSPYPPSPNPPRSPSIAPAPSYPPSIPDHSKKFDEDEESSSKLPRVFSPNEKIDPTTLSPAQLKVYNTFCNKEIDKEGPVMGYRQQLKAVRYGRDVEWGKLLKNQFGKWDNLKIWLILAIIVGASFALDHYKDEVVSGLKPIGQKLTEIPGGWAIPIGIIFVLSFPPLFGAEIIIILIGLIWGLWIGFGITSAGTLVGELGNFYLFMLLQKLADKYERKNMQWAQLAHIVREGGFKIVLACRYSAIPSHLTTAIFSTCGTGFWSFTVAAILSLPQKLPFVYAGVIFESSAEGTESVQDQIIFASTFGGTILVTLIVMYYIQRKMRACAIEVRQILRIKRAAALNEVSTPHYIDATKHRSLAMSEGTSFSDGDLKHSPPHGSQSKRKPSFKNGHTLNRSLDDDQYSSRAHLTGQAAPIGGYEVSQMEMQERGQTGYTPAERYHPSQRQRNLSRSEEHEVLDHEERERHRTLYEEAFVDSRTMLQEAQRHYPQNGRGMYDRPYNGSTISFEEGFGYAR